MAIHKGELRYSVGFDVDSKDLELSKQKLNDLISGLQQIQQKAQTVNFGDKTKQQIQAAAEEAKKLEQILNGAWNNKLGQLDLSQVKRGLQDSNLTIQQLKNSFYASGTEGKKAFDTIASSILNTNVQLKQSNAFLDKMALTFANTIRFGISSSVFNNFTGSIQKAYGYIQKLDKSLNDIRIVSDASAADMEKFAKYANQAAGAMGASTLDYTNAALIYYQQGLDEKQVKERSDITVKMANVLGTSASEVSDYMTAIWNNFDDGSKSLEYYADVLTSLGAKTASSAEEISTGLEKFAAISSTVGLSYEYAAAALTTVTDKTRQSAEVVGTAFKTLFARIQGLKLGETLDDGTTLNKYSEALAAVGIDIKDQSGNLKDMDDILDEMGAKWKTLRKDQQVALAQTVAGVRQYNQLMSLLNEWDSFQQNLEWAADATGELNKQQEIYMDSLAATEKQLEAQKQALYSSLFDKDAIVSFNKAVITALKGLNTYITGLGDGLNPLMTLLGHAGTLFSGQISKEINRNIQNKQKETKRQDINALKEDVANSYQLQGEEVSEGRVQAEAEIAKQILSIEELISEEQYQQLTYAQQKVGENTELIEQIEGWKTSLVEIDGLNASIADKDGVVVQQAKAYKTELESSTRIAIKQNSTIEEIFDLIGQIQNQEEDITDEQKEQLKQKLSLVNLTQKEKDALVNNTKNTKATEKTWQKLLDIQDKNVEKISINEEKTQKINTALEYQTQVAKGIPAELKAQNDELQEGVRNVVKENNELSNTEDIVRGISITISTLTSFKGIFDTWFGDNDLSTWEKIKSTLGVLIVQLPILIGNWKTMTGWIPKASAALQGYNTSLLANVAGHESQTAAVGKETVAEEMNTVSQEANNTVRKKGLILQLAELTYTIAQTVKTWALTAAKWAEAAAQTVVNFLTGNWIALAAAAAVAIVGLTVAVVSVAKAFWEVNNEDAKLQRQLEAAKERLTEMRDEYTELKNTISDYKDALEGIDKLTEGTADFYEAIEKANEKAKELIDTWHLVENQDYYIGSDGRIVIQQQALDDIQYKKNQEVIRAEAAVKEVELAQLRKKVEADQKELVRQGARSINKEAREQGSTARINHQQTEEIFKNLYNTDIKLGQIHNSLNDEKVVFGNISNDINKQGENVAGAVDDSAITISDSVTELGIQYQKNQAALIAAQRSLTWTLIRGYGKKEQIDTISGLSEVSKNAILDMSGRDFDRNAKNIREQYEGSHALDDELDLGTQLDMVVTHLTPGGRDSWQDYADDLYELKKTYAKNVLEMSSTEIKNTDLDEIISDADVKTAARTGSLYVTNTLKPYISEVKEIQGLTAKQGFTNTQTNYVLDAILSYQNDYSSKEAKEAMSKLTTPEFDIVKNYLSKNLNTDLVEQYKEYYDTETQRFDIEKFHKGMGNLNIFNGLIAEMNQYNQTMDQLDAYDQIIGDTESVARRTEQTKAYNDELKIQAENLGTTQKALQLYGYAMEKNGEVSKNQTADTAKQIAEAYKFNKIYNETADTYDKVSDAYDAYIKALEKGDTPSYDVVDSVGELQGALEGMLGYHVDPAFMEKNYKDIKQMLTGTAEEAEAAYNRIKRASLEDAFTYYFNMDKTEMQSLLDELDKLEPGQTLNEEWNKKLLDMINNSHMTLEEMEELFATAHLEMPAPDDYELIEDSAKTGETQTVHSYDGDIPVPDSSKDEGYRLEHINYQWTETTGPVEQKYVKFKNQDVQFKGSQGVSKNTANFTRSLNGQKKKNGGNSSKPKTVEHKDVEIDRYHKIDKQIEKVDKTLDKLQKDQDRLTGKSKFDNLTKQWQLLNQQAQNYSEKIKIAQGEQDELRAGLAKQGVTFNADGTVKNYVEIIKQKDAHLKSLQDQYNKLSAKQQEKWDEQKILQNAEEELSKLQKDLDRYDELTVNVIPELQTNKLEQELQKLETRISQLNLEVDVKLKTAEAERDWNAFRKRVIDKVQDDDILGNMRVTAADIATYISNNNSGQLDVDNAHLRYLLDHQNEFAADPVKYQEELDKAYKQVQDDLLVIQDLEEEMHQYNLDMLDEAQDKFDKQIDTYQQLGDMLEHDAKLVQMTLGDKAYEQLGQLFEKQHENNTQQLIFYRTQVDYWKQIRDGYKEGSDEWNNANEKMIEAMNNAESTLETVLQNTAEAFKNSINQMFKAFNDGLTKEFGLDYANEQWDLINKNADTYLDTINQIQGINDLERKYLDAINKNSNPAAQQKLQKIMSEQLTLLREKDRLTQSDLDMAQKRYDLYVAQIALEEAQRNKSTMYLRRDSRGNYRYQYAMDTEAYDKAKNDVDIARNALYNENKARAISDIENIQKTNEEMQQKLQKAMETNDLEMIALLDEQYTQWLGENRTEFAQHLAELDEAIAEEWLAKTGEDFTTASAERQAEIRRQLIPQLEALSRYSVDGLTSDSLAQLFAQAREMVNANKNTINEDLANGGRTLEELQEGKNQDIEIVTELLDKNQDLLDNYKEQIEATNDFVEAEIARVEALKAERDMVENATEAYEKLTNARNKEGADYAEALGLNTYSNTYGQEGMNTHDYEAAIEELKVLHNQALEEIAKAVYGSAAQEYIDLIKNNNSLSSNAITAGQVLRFASGGYTGNWAGTSRLAALDQKELILNATDTANMLNAVTVMRNLAYSLGETTLARLAGVAANSPGFKTDENGIIQDVHIDAQFPNVTNSREIEEAFNNLVNAASQRIFTNK